MAAEPAGKTGDDGREQVILLHGVWMRAFTLEFLHRRLDEAGFHCELFDYASVFGSPQTNVERLIARVRDLRAPKIHYVGHSLGGLVALQALRDVPDLPAGRVVCLGTPLRGSAVARALAHFPAGSSLIGKSTELLEKGLADGTFPRPVAGIAGRVPIGIGVLTKSLGTPHDGTVSVEETEVPGLADHRVVATTHLGLLLSEEVAALTIAFLRDGRFPRSAPITP